MKPRKPIRKVSTARAKRMREYSKRRVWFLAMYSKCAVFGDLRSNEIHHTRGRIGRLLNDERFWVPVSRKGHEWINNNPAEARKRTWHGLPLLCAVGQWNTVPASSMITSMH
ncbi:MAG: hypothetical protein E6R03_15415 [Hyphomicrobiaceae bacterium]|nr:MAG: hypothetical protein E6R03_15415 [Hyphomicrobiaceae bacterium]